MRVREYICEYQNYIMSPPVASQQLRSNSVSNDDATIAAWRNTWLDNIRANKEHFGSFKKHTIGSVYHQHLYKPAIIAGSGPSLKHNYLKLKDRKGIPLISCLHNFHFFEDAGIEPDYYVSLDAGPVVLEEISEGGKKTPDEYWELTKNRTLVAYIGSNPELFKKWQGRVLLYNAPLPNVELEKEIDDIERFRVMISNGGNVLGACLYFAKGWLGCPTTIFVGADFSFDPGDKRFHSWDSKYDAHMGHCIDAFNVFGHKVKTWQSYYNFKCWFDWVSLNVPGQYINCTEGGCLGSYAQGNLWTIKQMDLDKCFDMMQMSDHLYEQFEKPCSANKKILF